MNQRAVALVADYLSGRPRGRIVGLRTVRGGDYLMEIKDVRDGRVQLIRSVDDLEMWIKSCSRKRPGGGRRPGTLAQVDPINCQRYRLSPDCEGPVRRSGREACGSGLARGRSRV